MTRVLQSNAMNSTADFARDTYHVVVDADVTLDDILKPGFWAHHAQKIKVGTLIDVVNSDFTIDVQLRVLSVGRGFVNVRAIRVFEDDEKAAELAAQRAEVDAANNDPQATQAPEGYKVSHIARGPNAGFTVTLVVTNTKLHERVKTRAAAVQLAIEHARQSGTLAA